MVFNSSTVKVGKAVTLRFTITQHERDRELLELIIKYLNSGTLATSGNCKQVLVSKFQDIQNIIIPFFVKYNIKGVKLLDYLDFCQAAELIQNKAHLTQEGIDKILKLKNGMNRGRDSELS